MLIRSATIADIERCERLDSTYSTDHIWQMEERITSDSIHVSFRRVRIPRSVQIRDPRAREDLFEVWQHSRCFLVAEEAGQVVGFLNLVVERRTWQGWIEHLTVHRPYRRRGVASKLLEAAEQWARASELRGITAVVQSKNDPAIRLFPQRGYRFRGFIDRYYRNGDLGLLFCLEL